MARQQSRHVWSTSDSALPILIGWVVVALIGAGGWWWWQSRHRAPTPVAAVTSPAPASPTTPAEPAASAVDTVPEPPPAPASAVVTDDKLSHALAAVFGHQSQGSYLQLEDAAHRVAATVDNLARGHASSRLWPVPRTPQRLKVVQHGDRTFIAADNATRYSAFVQWIEAADTAQLIDVYVRWMPSLQRAYEDIGFPNKRFHARLSQVIDDLLAAPPQPAELEVRLVQVRGSVPSEQPWVRYEFVDPKLEAASAGQKVMLRVGAENRRRLETKLMAIRQELVRRSMK